MVTTGRFRPVQGAILFLFFCTSIYTLFIGPIDGSVSSVIFNPASLTLWNLLLFVGCSLSMSGELLQNVKPKDNLHRGSAKVLSTSKEIDRFVRGLMIELFGDILFVASMLAFVISAITASDGAAAVRMLVYAVLVIGFSGRLGQIILDIRRIRRAVESVSQAATGRLDRP